MASSLGKMPTTSVRRLISPLSRSILAMLLREGHVGEDVGLGLIHDRRELGHFRPDLVGNGPPLSARCLGCLLGASGADKSITKVASANSHTGNTGSRPLGGASILCMAIIQTTSVT